MSNMIRVVTARMSKAGLFFIDSDNKKYTVLSDEYDYQKTCETILVQIARQGYAIIESPKETKPILDEILDKCIKLYKLSPDALHKMLTEIDYSMKDIEEFNKLNKDIIEGLNSKKPLDTFAVVETDAGKVAIPGIDALSEYIKEAIFSRNATGLSALLVRLSNSIKNKNHSVADVIKFLSTSDLMLTDLGDILCYKRVNRCVDDDNKVYFADCHSGTVKQKVGSRVFMEPQQVDSDRNVSCSYGLHVASRSYIKSFSGTSLLLILVAPEDIVTVPHQENNKVRVSSYRILAEIQGKEKDLICEDSPITDMNSKAAIAISKAVSGDYTPILEHVEVVKGGCVVTPVPPDTEPKQNTKPKAKRPVLRKVSLEGSNTSQLTVQKMADTLGLTHKSKFAALLKEFNKADKQTKISIAKQLEEIRKKRKTSFSKLGATDKQVLSIKELL